MDDGHHGHQRLDGGVGLCVHRLRLLHVGDGRSLFQHTVDLRMDVAVLRVLGAEVEVQEVGDVRVVRAPAQEVEAVEAAVGGLVDELARFHHHHFGVDAQVVAQLGLELDCYDARLRQVAAEHVAKVDLGLEAVGVAGLGQQGARRLGIEVVPGLALAAVGDRARGEVGGHFRAGRIEIVDDPLAVDPHGDGLANLELVEGLEGAGHGEIEDVGVGHRQEGQAVVVLHRLEIVRAEIGDLVHRAGAQLDQAPGAAVRPAEHQGPIVRLVAPVIVEAAHDDAVAAGPFLQHPGRRADGTLEDLAAAAGRVQVLLRLNAEGREGGLGHESRVRLAHGELDGQLIDGLDRLDLAAVVAIRSRDGIALERGGRSGQAQSGQYAGGTGGRGHAFQLGHEFRPP